MGFKKGQSGNPAGRPKKGEALTDILKAFLDKKDGSKTRKQQLVERLYDLAMAGEVSAMKYIFDRIDGKVPDKLEFPEGINVDIRFE